MPAIVFMFAVISVNAADLSLNVEYDYNNSRVIIEGEVESSSEYVTIQLLKQGKNMASFEDEDVLYRNQIEVENKSFRFNVGYDLQQGEYGTYNAYIMAEGSDSIAQKGLYLVPYDDYKSFYDELDTALSQSDEIGFKKVINEKRTLAGFDNELTKGKDLNDWLDNYYLYVKDNKPDKSENDENKRVFLTYMTAAALNAEKVENLETYINDIIVFDNALLEKYREIADKEVIQMYFTQKLSGRNIISIEDFENEFKKALILTGVRYADGFGEAKELLNLYGEVFDIAKNTDNAVYQKLCGNDYTQENFASAFDDLVLGVSNSTGSSDTGRGKGGTNLSGVNISSTIIGNSNANISGMPILFEDIEGVAWASEAILALADKNIINGKEPGKFKPDDEITREEFVKILICAMGYEDKPYSDYGFTDVNSDDWFFKYVTIAAENGIVQGVGEGFFGTGRLITRQDLVTMIYNVLKSKNIALDISSPSFADIEYVDDYAVDAVSALYNLGAVNGVSDTEFAPLNNATRAQAAKIIYGVLGLLG